MTEFIFPADGSVLVVDDKPEDALPLIELLSSKGIASTYYSGDDTKLPSQPKQKVRLAFFDIQLFGPSTNTASYSANILRLINRLIPSDNGPYVLVLWTTIAIHEADEVEQQIKVGLIDKKPLAILRLEKATYFETSSDNSQKDSLIQEIQESLSTRFPPDDIVEIQRVVNNELLPVDTRKAKVDAIEKISLELSHKLQDAADSFQLFTYWESAINRAAGTTVENFASLNNVDEHWSINLKNVIFRMAHAQLGQNIDNVENDEVLSNALKTLNGTFLDLVEHHYPSVRGFSSKVGFSKDNIKFTRTVQGQKFEIKWNYKSGKFQIYIDDILVPANSHGVALEKVPGQGRTDPEKAHLATLKAAYESITPLINTKLLVDTLTSDHVQPGNVYLKHIRLLARRKSVLRNYYKELPEKGLVWDKNRAFLLSDKELKKFKFIELEVTPICDYAQKKWIKYRLLPGVMIPVKYNVELNTGLNFYHEIPVIKIDGDDYRVVFDFRLLKSIDMIDHGSSEPYFRLRSELSASILSRLSSHASRIGITSLE